MKLLLLLPGLVAVILLSSFKGHQPPADSATAAGIYGMCSTEKLPFTFEVSLNEDHTFHYVNNSVPGKAIDTKGTWEQNGNVITLSNYTSKFPIHTKWKLNSDNFLKSRKGLEFTSLQKCQ